MDPNKRKMYWECLPKEMEALLSKQKIRDKELAVRFRAKEYYRMKGELYMLKKAFIGWKIINENGKTVYRARTAEKAKHGWVLACW